MINLNGHELNALRYAERHGIIDYTVEGNEMKYYENFPVERSTYKCVVNLDTLKESRQALKYYYKHKGCN